MGKLDYKFLPLTFISSEEEIKRQITNTAIFSFLENKFDEVVQLSELLESTQYGYNAPALSSGENKFLRISDIKDGKVNWDTVPFCDCTDEESYLLYSKDVLVARTGGTTGKSFLINNPPDKSVFAGYLIRLRANKKLLPDFLNLFLNSYAYWSQISEMKSGSAQPNVNAEKLKQLLIPYCPVELQREILSLLKDFKTEKRIWKELLQTILDVQNKFKKNNEVIELLTTQQTLITQLRQSILQEAVQGKLSERGFLGLKDSGINKHSEKKSHNPSNPTNPSSDNDAAELLKRIKAEKEKLIKQGKLKKEKLLPPIGENEIPYQLPVGWVWCRFVEIAEIIMGQSPDGMTYNDKGTGVPLINGPVEFGKGHFDKTIKSKWTTSPTKMCKEGDLILCVRGSTTGRTNIAAFDACIGRGVAAIRPKIYEKYVHYFVLQARTAIFNLGTGTTFPSISQDEILNLLFPLPPLPEQKRIVEKVNQLMQHCHELEQQVQQSISHAQQLMQAVLREVFEKKKEYKVEERVSLAAEE